jgi:TldD protein
METILKFDLAQKIIQAGTEVGADFVEVYVEEHRSSSVEFKDSKVENASAATDYGVGIRLLYGTEMLYTHTSDDRESILLELIRELAFGREVQKSSQGRVQFEKMNFPDLHAMQKDPRIVGQLAKLDYLQRANAVARSMSSQISQVSARAFDSLSNIEIFNSEGLYATDRRAWTRFSVGVTAEQNGERFSAHEAPGAMGGFEVLENMNVEYLAQTAAERALRMLNAEYVQGGQIPVIMGNGFGGVIFHEACGHPLETESVRRNASPFANKIGQKIAHESVTAIDDGTIPGSWGSINIDDEGMPTQKTVLIEKGILKTYLSDKIGAQEVGVPRTGSARRQSYQFAPVARMRNTYIAQGTHSTEDIFASVPSGLYAKKMGGGSVNPATGEFNFAVEEGYLVENGKIGKPVRGATLIGKGHEILPRISMVGNDLEHAAGMCGASSGSIPVTVGQPMLKVDKILVGGR